MNVVCRLVLVVALTTLGLLGVNSAASATTGYTADCADVRELITSNHLQFSVTNRCAVGVTMKALVSNGYPTECLGYDPGQERWFNEQGVGMNAHVQDVVYC